MSELNPIQAAKNIKEKYIEYLLTTFKIADKEIEEQFKNELFKKNKLSKGPFLEVSNSFEKGKSINQLIKESVLTKEFKNFNSQEFPFKNKDLNIYFHQEQAIKKVANGENIIVSTGTGSGKTESFLIPILNHLLAEKEKGILSSGVRALILYPMNALVNDQMERFRKLLKDYPEITFGKFTGETEHKQQNAEVLHKEVVKEADIIPNEIISRDEMRKNPPHILITNYAMLEYLMLRPEDNTFFDGPNAKFWNFIVLDEAHTYKGALGIELSMLLRRLKETIKKTNNIRFILTSASLGRGVKDNPDIVKFAENLTGENFKEENIIGATRVKYTTTGDKKFDLNIYTKISEVLEDKNKIIDILKEYKLNNYFENIDKYSIEEILFELILKDENFYKLRCLLNEPKEVYEILKEMNILDENYLLNFIKVASKAKKDNVELFKSKYHYFFKALEGGFLSLYPKKNFYLNRMEKVNIDDETLKVFEISTCKFCNEIYLVGEVVNSRFHYKVLNQKINYMTEDASADLEYFLLKSDIIEKNEDENFSENEKLTNEPYELCAKCGGVFNKNYLGDKCNCGNKYLIDVIRINKNTKMQTLHTCRSCGSTNPKSSVLKRFVIGAEGATAALGTALHESLPDTIIKTATNEVKEISTNRFFGNKKTTTKKREETIRQFLVFSDSRQAAAYYATFMEESYNKFLRKRVVYEVISKSNIDLSIDQLINQVQAIFETNKIFETKDCQAEACKSVFFELFSIDRRYSLEGVGLAQFYIDFDKEQIDTGLFSLEETNALLQELCNIFKYKSIIDYDHYNITKSQKEYFMYSTKENYINLSDQNIEEGIFSWLTTKNNNSRFKLIEKVLNAPTEMIKEFLIEMWKSVLNSEEKPLLKVVRNNYKLNIENIKVRSGNKIDWYYCKKCKKITPNNIKNICPTYSCNGLLEKINPNDLYKENHYRNLTKELLIKPFKINEHTAQLDAKLAYKIQKQFSEKQINVLSCSTTFEVGVDVGELETVFMRNMPPSPANYSQRAGRAGRRGSSSAFILTFCSQKSHDFNFYKNPIQMIKGMIPPPKFDLNNKKIILRHIYAICFSHFWKSNINYYGEGKVLNSLADNIVQSFKEYLLSKPNEIKIFLKNILNEEIKNDLGIDKWEWVDSLISDSPAGAIYRAKKEFFSEINEIDEAIKKLKSDILNSNKIGNKAYNLKSIEMMKANIESKITINYFAQKNLLPRYGFPVDTVELYSNTKDELRLSRDLGIAISEYAPGGQVIANGNLLTSRYLKKVPTLNWKIYNYGICKECKTLNQHLDTKITEEREKCSNCGEEVNLSEKYIVPEFGFKIENTPIEKAGTKKPKKLYSSDIYAIENKNAQKIAEKEVLWGEGRLILKSFKDEEMGIISQNKFYICETCGYGEKGIGNTNQPFKTVKHENSTGYECKTQLKPYSLGHKFKTDIVSIDFISKNYLEINESLLYAILEGISSILNIDRTDIAGCLKKIDRKNHIVIYDTVPGGAGHVKRLLEEDNMIKILKEAFKIVSECECGEETSCYSCLRDYSNQRYHENLSRGNVINTLNSLKNN
ncbi:DEAD/DEAH box helicase [Cetobacterium sp. 2A]|uniref:DEAD/DEAH box helicase n=1 Tax=Cetobacterium sp. 2A TaxID=2754723 RepID=UPI00163C92F6|nr:DEAD/DEAH box helicase [Cetobacterium sp. 2A]MBC2857090.1 DEAD/DEAH box helicase [Cetobacterium sp. 2A]